MMSEARCERAFFIEGHCVPKLCTHGKARLIPINLLRWHRSCHRTAASGPGDWRPPNGLGPTGKRVSLMRRRP